MIRRRKINLYNGEFSDILSLAFSKQSSDENYIKQFEKKFAEYIGTKHAIATYSGRSGMVLLLEALRLKRGDEIIFPAYTLKTLITLAQKLGLKPVLVDIEKDSFNINPDIIEGKITKKTKVIVATHMFGLPCNIKKILRIAKKHGIYVIEDCCLAHGADVKGKKVGSFGVGGFFSFQRIKLINTLGGGMITINDDEIAEFIRRKVKKLPYNKNNILKKMFWTYLEDLVLRSPMFYVFSSLFYFKPTKKLFNNLYISFSGSTMFKGSRYTNTQAFVGLKQLYSLDERVEKRRKNAKLLSKLMDKEIQVQRNKLDCGHVYYYFMVRSDLDSEKVQRIMLSKGLDTSSKDEITDDCTKTLKEFSKECPITHDVFKHAIQVPVYESLDRNDIHRIADVLNQELV